MKKAIATTTTKMMNADGIADGWSNGSDAGADAVFSLADNSAVTGSKWQVMAKASTVADKYMYINATVTDKFTPGGKHHRHSTDEHAHLRRVRTPKHRYVHVPNRRLRKRVMPDVKYPALPYPKGDNERYTLGERHRTTVLDTRTGETFKD